MRNVTIKRQSPLMQNLCCENPLQNCLRFFGLIIFCHCDKWRKNKDKNPSHLANTQRLWCYDWRSNIKSILEGAVVVVVKWSSGQRAPSSNPADVYSIYSVNWLKSMKINKKEAEVSPLKISFKSFFVSYFGLSPGSSFSFIFGQ